MYGATIPEDEDAEAILSKLEQAKNQAPNRRGFGLVVALCVGVVIGALGTIVLMAGGPEPQAPSLDARRYSPVSMGAPCVTLPPPDVQRSRLIIACDSPLPASRR